MSLKTVKKRGIHDYESIMKGINRQLRIELSPENVELISQYDMEMQNLLRNGVLKITEYGLNLMNVNGQTDRNIMMLGIITY